MQDTAISVPNNGDDDDDDGGDDDEREYNFFGKKTLEGFQS